MPIPPFAIKGLFFSYPGFAIFSDFDIASEAKVVVLKGPSGCGKTTLLKLVTGNLIPDRVEQFNVPANGCLIVQEDSLLPWLSGTDNIREIVGLSLEEITAHPMFTLVGNYIGQKAYTMSYGQRRAIEIFRAVLFRPRLLCLDEPLNFLDPSIRRAIVEFLRAPDLADTRIILSTHHGDDLDKINGETFVFDGQFPVRRLGKA